MLWPKGSLKSSPLLARGINVWIGDTPNKRRLGGIGLFGLSIVKGLFQYFYDSLEVKYLSIVFVIDRGYLQNAIHFQYSFYIFLHVPQTLIPRSWRFFSPVFLFSRPVLFLSPVHYFFLVPGLFSVPLIIFPIRFIAFQSRIIFLCRFPVKGYFSVLFQFQFPASVCSGSENYSFLKPFESPESLFSYK